ncbi:MAG: tyrosine-type recombinase/integrase [Planctomycetes bacterium]|nr:tyrosine-type recombinase/integrase [Planctomycetota bacterium]
MWLAFLSTGLRHAELVSLTWNDVDIDKGLITVRGSKTDASARVVPITHELKVEFNKMSKEQGGYVFKTEIGTQFKNNLLKRFQECLKRAGIYREGLKFIVTPPTPSLRSWQAVTPTLNTFKHYLATKVPSLHLTSKQRYTMRILGKL